MMQSDSQVGKFIYLCINLLLIACGAILSRRMFAVFGGLGEFAGPDVMADGQIVGVFAEGALKSTA